MTGRSSLRRPIWLLAWLSGAAPEVPPLVWHLWWRAIRLIGVLAFMALILSLVVHC